MSELAGASFRQVGWMDPGEEGGRIYRTQRNRDCVPVFVAEAGAVNSAPTPTDDKSRTPLPEGTQIKDPNGVIWTLGTDGRWHDGSGFHAYAVVGDVIDSAPTDHITHRPGCGHWPERTPGA